MRKVFYLLGIFLSLFLLFFSIMHRLTKIALGVGKED